MRSLSVLSRVFLRLGRTRASGAVCLGHAQSRRETLLGRGGAPLVIVFEHGHITGFAERRVTDRRSRGSSRSNSSTGLLCGDREDGSPRAGRHHADARRTEDRRQPNASAEQLAALLTTHCQRIACERFADNLAYLPKDSAPEAEVRLEPALRPDALVLEVSRALGVPSVAEHWGLDLYAPGQKRGRFALTSLGEALHLDSLSDAEAVVVSALRRGPLEVDAATPPESQFVMARLRELGLVKRHMLGSSANLLSVTRAMRQGRLRTSLAQLPRQNAPTSKAPSDRAPEAGPNDDRARAREASGGAASFASYFDTRSISQASSSASKSNSVKSNSGGATPLRPRELRRLAAKFHPDRFEASLSVSSRRALEALLRLSENT